MPLAQSLEARQGTQRPSVESQTGFGAVQPVAQLGPPPPGVPVDDPPFGVPVLDAPPFVDGPPFPDPLSAPAPPFGFAELPESPAFSSPPQAVATIRVADRANAETTPRDETNDIEGLL